MEGHCSTGQRPQWAVVPMEEEDLFVVVVISHSAFSLCVLNKIFVFNSPSPLPKCS